MTSQSGLKMQPPPSMRTAFSVRGVVVAVYFADEPGAREDRGGGEIEAKAASVDVLVYGGRRGFLARVPVVQRRHGIADYEAWTPRETTMDLSTGQPPVFARSETEVAGDPRNFDGDHVLVEFFENDPQQPFVRDSLPHPLAAFRQLKSDGPGQRSRSRGVELSVDQNGNVRLDTTKANSGALTAEGLETPADDSTHGRVTVLVAQHATVAIQGQSPDGTSKTFELTLHDGEFEVRLQDGASFKVAGNGDGTVVTVGNGGASAVRGERLQAQYEELVAALEGHAHPDGFGSTAPAGPVFPTWGANILSNRFKRPDE